MSDAPAQFDFFATKKADQDAKQAARVDTTQGKPVTFAQMPAGKRTPDLAARNCFPALQLNDTYDRLTALADINLGFSPAAKAKTHAAVKTIGLAVAAIEPYIIDTRNLDPEQTKLVKAYASGKLAKTDTERAIVALAQVR